MKKIKKFFNKHGVKALIGTIIFLLIGVIALLVGGTMAGWDILGWLTSQTAILIYAATAVVLLGLAGIVLYSKLGGDDK